MNVKVDPAVERAQLLIRQLQIHGYRALPCSNCGRRALLGVNEIHELLRDLVRLAPDAVCEHGAAVDVHCCNCHNGFLFDVDSCVCKTEAD